MSFYNPPESLDLKNFPSYPDSGGNMPHTVTRLLNAERCCLVVIDPQEKLMNVIHKADKISNRIAVLVNCFNAMNIPVTATTQYVKGLGPFVSNLSGLIPAERVADKMEFNAFSNPGFVDMLKSLGASIDSLVLCGVEAHICVYQTAVGAVNAGYRVWVASDAVSSRDKHNRKDALKAISRFAAVGPSEMIIYQLLERAGTERFKAVLPFIK